MEEYRRFGALLSRGAGARVSAGLRGRPQGRWLGRPAVPRARDERVVGRRSVSFSRDGQQWLGSPSPPSARWGPVAINPRGDSKAFPPSEDTWGASGDSAESGRCGHGRPAPSARLTQSCVGGSRAGTAPLCSDSCSRPQGASTYSPGVSAVWT